MTLYSIALFFHVVGALGFFIALGLEWFSLGQLQRSTTVEQLRDNFKAANSTRGLAGISMLIILIAGFYMTFVAWAGAGATWIGIAFAAMILQGVVAGVLTTRRLKVLQKAIVDASGPLTPSLYTMLYHPLLRISMFSRLGIALGIIFLMTVKPALVAALIAMVVATAVGLLWALVTTGGRPQQAMAAQ